MFTGQHQVPLLPNNASDVLTNPAMLGTLGRRLLHRNRRDGETETPAPSS